MKRFYFTFGSDPAYDFGRDDYVIVEAANMEQALCLFRAVHPSRPGSACINCASWYPEEEWKSCVARYYSDTKPKEIIRLSIERRK